jgi:hypothetical protein
MIITRNTHADQFFTLVVTFIASFVVTFVAERVWVLKNWKDKLVLNKIILLNIILRIITCLEKAYLFGDLSIAILTVARHLSNLLIIFSPQTWQRVKNQYSFLAIP